MTCLPLRLVLSLDEEVSSLHKAESYGDGEKTKQTSRGHRDDLRSVDFWGGGMIASLMQERKWLMSLIISAPLLSMLKEAHGVIIEI